MIWPILWPHISLMTIKHHSTKRFLLQSHYSKYCCNSFQVFLSIHLYKLEVNLNPHTVLFIPNRYWKWGASVRLTPPPHPPVFLPKLTRIFGPFLLVDGRALPQPATHFYWSTGGENRQLSPICWQPNHWGVSADLIPSEQGLYMPKFFIFLFLTR